MFSRTVLLIGSVFFWVGCAQKEVTPDLSSLLLLSPDRIEDYDRDIQFISDRIVPDSYGQVTYELASEAEISVYLNLLQGEIAKYPKGYWIKARAGKVVLGKNMMVGSQYRAAVPDAYQDVLYLSVNGQSGGGTEDYLIHVIHHELNHNVDFAHFGDMRAVLPEWDVLNPADFKYGSGGVQAYNDPEIPWSALNNPLSGFLDLYATLAQEEDRSEFAALLLGSEKEVDILHDICLQDQRVAAKSKKMIEIMNRFWPYANSDTYWNRINVGTACQ
ncbi:hypothetical protein EHQ12_02640 [Leptospira gomenensis]|uniref:Lipoprotein n=1 Tax=Leptospira gomenensis TaxID=2484974 RepID=A0A5F1Y906_9LEPT|nr:hypothetical protein [Leptospira gomenensis]TGK32378.1 hypothetical protein EHQ17_12655 [Leptospira gomenensis]TGK43978.1 hypothetical protein EHQ12_02640 [Leptospira gomenensis]TGK48945.1 hypothetical protein EHQ07_05250 [Leptospira gomenensis]TGK54656.1 hypothetical protein EHQ13_19220 [Leptospira gomenensis]